VSEAKYDFHLYKGFLMEKNGSRFWRKKEFQILSDVDDKF
jgi:hypothetical protein